MSVTGGEIEVVFEGELLGTASQTRFNLANCWRRAESE